ncbi:hypothetical protein OsI_37961 [Oryza sativa Indica Group]|uniref:Uncharacterized protein n=1 Tax=Oryza sativa subsp. indica TaxID=39946 RepID=A2ZJG9_ORYSI|nr:hypothetical protein OsI_37961 [Oryza sativa Indica Group]
MEALPSNYADSDENGNKISIQELKNTWIWKEDNETDEEDARIRATSEPSLGDHLPHRCGGCPPHPATGEIARHPASPARG